jgi:hypothetical protein
MTELEQFEARLAASLEHLADEVPTTVDSRELTAAIVATEAGRGWLHPAFGAHLRPRAAVLRYALAAAALLLLAAAVAAVLAPRFMAAPFDAMTHGRMTCSEAAWESSATDPVVLDCVLAMPDTRLAGNVQISLGAPSTAAGGISRFGSIALSGNGARWTGTIQVTAAPNEAAFGDGRLHGSDAADGQVLYLHLMSGDGLTWGVLGNVVSGG